MSETMGDRQSSREVAKAHPGEELEALYATVRSLAALQEVDDVLQAIVRNAHVLVETDVTHLSLVDRESNEFFVRAVEGDASAEFRRGRISIGLGVAGRVFATGKPFAVANYRSSAEIQHDPAFDALMRREGLVALVGVPLVLGDDVVGVLHGASRQERPFNDEEIALLSAFADHAAVALDNARLYEEKARALSDLSEAYQRIEAHAKALERSARVHDALTSLVLSGGKTQEVAELLGKMIGGRVALLDREDKLLATESHRWVVKWLQRRELLQADGQPNSVLAEAILESGATGHCALVETPSAHCHVVSVMAGKSHLGALIVVRDVALDEIDIRTIERGAQIVGLLTLQHEAVLDAEERVRGDFVTELLSSPTRATAQQYDRAAARGIDLPSLRTLVVISCPTEQRLAASRMLRHVAREAHGLAGEHLGALVVLLPGVDLRGEADRLQQVLRTNVSSPLVSCAAALDLPHESAQSAFVLARRGCQLLLSLGADDKSACVSDLAMYATILHPGKEGDLRTFVEETLGPLTAYDLRGRADLLRTLRAYFRNSGNLSQTAVELHIHINTLLKRLDRVSCLVGSEWKEPDNALRLHMALRLSELADSVEASEPAS
jgi:hypothetical protein